MKSLTAVRMCMAGFVLFASALAWAQKEVPFGWHEPSQEELKLKFQADLDGDGKPDTARILADVNKRAVGVFAYLSSNKRWFKLDSESVKDMPKWHVKALEPGAYTFTCDKDEKHCTPGETRLANAAVDLTVEGKADSVFYWDSAAQAFKHGTITK